MRPYDPGKPLISLHVPKCAGNSLRRQLRAWFRERFRVHYFQKRQAPPERLELGPGDCLHGHFNNDEGFGALQYYPEADQFVTFLRHPLEMAVSGYFFWRRKGRANRIRRGTLVPGDPENDFRDIHHYFAARRRSPLFRYLPFDFAGGDAGEIFDRHFVCVGIVERFAESLALLGRRLGRPVSVVEHLNPSPRDEAVTAEEARRYEADNAREFEAYAVAVRHLERALRGEP